LICDTFWCLGRGLSIQLDPSDEVVISETDGQPAEDECLNKNAQVPVRPSIFYALRRILYWSKKFDIRSLPFCSLTHVFADPLDPPLFLILF